MHRCGGEVSSSAGAFRTAGRSRASTSSRGWPGPPTRSATRSSRSPTTSSCPPARRRRTRTTRPARSRAARSSRTSSPSRSPPGCSSPPPAACASRSASSWCRTATRWSPRSSLPRSTRSPAAGSSWASGSAGGREEFEALAAPPFAERGAVTDEYLRLMKTLWTRGRPALRGQVLPGRRRHDAAPAGPEAPSADLGRRSHRAGAPPDGAAWATRGIPSGSAAPPAWRPTSWPRRWRGSGPSPARPAGTRRPIGVAFRAPLDLWPARGKTRPRRPARWPARPTRWRRLRAYQAAGVDTIIFDFPEPDPAAMVAAMRRVAREVRPRLARRRHVPRPMTATDTFAADGRVARLATVDEAGYPHVVPVVLRHGRSRVLLAARRQAQADAGQPAQARPEHPGEPAGRSPHRPLRGGLGARSAS